MKEDLIFRLKQREEAAFEEVYNMYNKLVFFVIFKIVKDRELTNDLVQETFFTMHSKIDQYSGVGNFKYWLLQIAKNKAKNYVKKIVKEKELITSDNRIVDNIIDGSIDFEGFEKKLENLLDPVSKDIVISKILFDCTFKDIANSLELSESDVYRRYNKAISKIKDHIEIR